MSEKSPYKDRFWKKFAKDFDGKTKRNRKQTQETKQIKTDPD